MQKKQRKDYQTIRLFLILGILTLVLVFVLQLVLFSPAVPLVETATF